MFTGEISDREIWPVDASLEKEGGEMGKPAKTKVRLFYIHVTKNWIIGMN